MLNINMSSIKYRETDLNIVACIVFVFQILVKLSCLVFKATETLMLQALTWLELNCLPSGMICTLTQAHLVIMIC